MFIGYFVEAKKLLNCLNHSIYKAKEMKIEKRKNFWKTGRNRLINDGISIKRWSSYIVSKIFTYSNIGIQTSHHRISLLWIFHILDRLLYYRKRYLKIIKKILYTQYHFIQWKLRYYQFHFCLFLHSSP